jgi:hypothetical protein
MQGSSDNQSILKLFTSRLSSILVKRRKIGNLEEDGGCGCEWFTFEMPEEILIGSM